MNIVYRGEPITTFTISPRTYETSLYLKNIKDAVRWSDKYEFTGVLLFTGNDTYADPWLVAQTVFADTRSLSPLVAVNPIYMHPYTAAKMVASFAYMHGRKTYLNMITGTALNYLRALNSEVSHDDRYVQLEEYIQVMKALLERGRPVDFDGRFYKVSGAHLLPRVPPALQPGFLLSGQSDAALRTAAAVGAMGMQMLAPELEKAVKPGVAGIHFGIVTRETRDDAWRCARAMYPEDAVGQEMLAMSMKNTDSVWKQRMNLAAKGAGYEGAGYWMVPFRNFKADCPYFVGSYAEAASLVARLVRAGVRSLILDIPAAEEDFAHARTALERAGRELGA